MKYKLRNTITEMKIEQRIVNLTRYFHSHFNKEKIIKLIETHIPEIKSLYVLQWIDYGQGDNQYLLFINKEWLVNIELDDDEEEPLLLLIDKIGAPSEAGLDALIALELEKTGAYFLL
ncbi:hypothetical protein [Candidatus Odyssella thessalonicensis]|uniref:hypothetical protein n=1 Tax=Candidatus Odyssella thessalonicensis TaxID=84647 RepID=UPI000225BD97|nr:hypothetical protein [Candidatus Odyssella thessalonicensis]